jgi:NTE family protein
MSKQGESSAALVLAGAVAKGAFEAGVVSVLADRGITFNRFVGTSAGALGATLLAVGAACGRFDFAAKKLEDLWRDHAVWWNFIAPTLQIHRGLSSTRGVERIIRRALRDVVSSAGKAGSSTRCPTTLTLVTTNVRGAAYGPLDDTGVRSEFEGETTHEDEHVFGTAALLDANQWPHIAAVAAASAAFPGLFVPPKLEDGDGKTDQHVDGGIVNDTPLSYAIDEHGLGAGLSKSKSPSGEDGTSSVVVVGAEPKGPPPRRSLWGIALGTRLIEILINERIERDVIVAEKRNRKRAELLAELAGKNVDAAAIADRLGFREIDILRIRPDGELAGGAFGGFFRTRWREDQIEAGQAAARAAFLKRDVHNKPFPRQSTASALLSRAASTVTLDA